MNQPRSPQQLVSRTALAAFAALAALVGAAAPACEDPEIFIPLQQFGGPAGVIEGTVTYTGPAPCFRNGHILGAAAILAFDTRLLPPPEGLGTSAASVDIVSGDELFAGVRAQVEQNPDGCLNPAEKITVSATWAIAPLPAGTYQIRGFYDLDGDFDPAFSISTLPTRGDVGGGAIQNPVEAGAGTEPPRYREITLGVNGQIPPEGDLVEGVAVSLGLSLPLERPVFHVAEVLAPAGESTDPANVVMSSDYQLPVFSGTEPAATEQSFIRLRLGAGVPAAEAEAAAKPPFFMPVGPGETPVIHYSRQDVNGDGVKDEADHVPDSTQIPALYPLSVFSKLAEGQSLVSQSAPAVILQGLTLYKGIVSTGLLLTAPEVTTPDQPDALIALRPAALCLHPADPARGGVLVVSHATDAAGNPVLANEQAVKDALTAQFKRPIEIAYGCLPEGRYAMNLVYESGQAWTVPNEAGVCAPSEAPSSGKCGTRPRLASQSVLLTVGPPKDPAYCTQNPTPALCRP